MAQESIRIGKAELSAFVAAIFSAVGLAKDHAGTALSCTSKLGLGEIGALDLVVR